MIEVVLNKPDDFLKIKETLTRIGVASFQNKELYQSCHILHKKGKYFICHFKEMFILDGKTANIDESDYSRVSMIAKLLVDWNLCSTVDTDLSSVKIDNAKIKVIKHSEREEWVLVPKYKIGVKK